jgi:hypothetical protein
LVQGPLEIVIAYHDQNQTNLTPFIASFTKY